MSETNLVESKAWGTAFDRAATGTGTTADPLRLPLREKPNATECEFCPVARCPCTLFEEELAEAVASVAAEHNLKRVTEVTGKRHLCAKSVLSPFVSRMVALLDITREDTFFDFGAGDGSVVFQVAFMTGARGVAVELSEHNAEYSRKLWAALAPRLEKVAGRVMPEIEFVAQDLCDYLAGTSGWKSPKAVVWTANKLMPRRVTNYMAQCFRDTAPGARLLCFDDLYPHGREVMKWRDPEAFELFAMTDYEWTSGSVEWTTDIGPFYRHVRTAAPRAPCSDSE